MHITMLIMNILYDYYDYDYDYCYESQHEYYYYDIIRVTIRPTNSYSYS